MNKSSIVRNVLFTAGSACIVSNAYAAGPSASKIADAGSIINDRPNIIFIMADDMGYGDLSCFNPESKIKTPNMDKLAADGMRFTNAHSPSAVCTPTRYGVLTGRYCWRTSLKKGVLGGYSKLLIEKDRLTVASMLKDKGYHTACVGKWHLGLTDTDPVDFSKSLRPGPNEVGFDYWYGIPASLDMAPYCFIENGLPTEPLSSKLPGDTLPRFYREGDASPGFAVDDVMPNITAKACAFINKQAANNSQEPFFLYFPLTAPHTPWVPLPEYEKMSKAGVYGDFVAQVDSTVGAILDTLKTNGLDDNTIVILTSDNGSYLKGIGDHNNGVSKEGEYNFGHDSNYIFRGQKSDAWDGGHHVPYIVCWPGVVAAGSESAQTVSLVDLTATCADIVGYDLPDTAAEDSYSILPVLQAKTLAGPLREATVYHSVNGEFAIQKGKWKYIDCVGSGGWSGKGDGLPAQLYNTAADPSEKNNLYKNKQYQAKVKELKQLLKKYKSQGHSRPM